MMMFIRGIRDISRIGASFLEAYWAQCNAELNGNALGVHILLLVCIIAFVALVRLSNNLSEYLPQNLPDKGEKRGLAPGSVRIARHIMKRK